MVGGTLGILIDSVCQVIRGGKVADADLFEVVVGVLAPVDRSCTVVCKDGGKWLGVSLKVEQHVIIKVLNRPYFVSKCCTLLLCGSRRVALSDCSQCC